MRDCTKQEHQACCLQPALATARLSSAQGSRQTSYRTQPFAGSSHPRAFGDLDFKMHIKSRETPSLYCLLTH